MNISHICIISIMLASIPFTTTILVHRLANIKAQKVIKSIHTNI